MKNDYVTPATRVRDSLDALHWSVRFFASITEWDERTIRRWLSGRYDPPADVLATLETLAAAHRDNPFPRRIRATPQGT